MSAPERTPSLDDAPIAVLAGGSGFVGGALREALRREGWTIRELGRTGPDARWSDPASIRRVVEGAAMVINLAGKSVNCRYTRRARDEIYRSRIETTRALRGRSWMPRHPRRSG